MFAVLAEDHSDVESLIVLIKRISGIHNQKILRKGFGGCGELRRKACRVLEQLSKQGGTRFVICHDADRSDPAEIRAVVRAALRDDRCARLNYEVVIPIQELEAWIIADESAIARVIPSVSIPSIRRPESLESPKEWLVRQSRVQGSKPRYVPAIHNAKVASFIDLAKLEQKCPSFIPLKEFANRR
jgi:Domain of unknown function (DUF4276)